MRSLKLAVGLLVMGGAGCESPEVEPTERYIMSEVYHVLNDEGRRTGEMTADSMVVLNQGNVVLAWNVAVRLNQGSVEIRADSMTIDWPKHEMRYHGIVDIPSLSADIELRDLTLYAW
jgi:lipopolysaccharide export system protein LptA